MPNSPVVPRSSGVLNSSAQPPAFRGGPSASQNVEDPEGIDLTCKPPRQQQVRLRSR
jgi:hypothetical protein